MMMTILIVTSSILFLVSCISFFLLRKVLKKLFIFDDLLAFFVHDIDVNIKYLDKLSNTPLFTNAPEVLEMQQNMRIIKARLDEYSIRMEEMAGKELRDALEKVRNSNNPPVVR